MFTTSRQIGQIGTLGYVGNNTPLSPFLFSHLWMDGRWFRKKKHITYDTIRFLPSCLVSSCLERGGRQAAGINALLPAPPIANPLSDSRNFFYKKPGAFPLLRPVLSSHVFSSSLLFSGLSGCPMLRTACQFIGSVHPSG